MSLRELPPEQAVRRDRWRHLRYVPLVVLLVCALLAALGGFYVTRLQAAALEELQDSASRPAPVTPTPTADGDRALPASCTPAVEGSGSEPWVGEAAAASEAVWTAHADDLSEAYVHGRDGWIFWGDIQAQNFSQALGRRSLSVAEAGTWRTYLTTLRDGLAAEGIPLYIVVAPAKWAVYPQQLPEWTDGIRGSSALDQLIAGGSDLPFVDLRAPLREASEEHPTYSAVNSHWTDWGAAVGWRSTTACMAASDPAFEGIGLPPVSGVTVSDEGNEFASFGVDSPGPDWTSPQFAQPLLPMTVSIDGGPQQTVAGERRIGLEEMPAETWTEGAQSDLSALVVRDSFGVSLSTYIDQSFAHTWQIRHFFDYPADQQPDILAVAREKQPDVVILQIAQRHLVFPPPVP